MIKLVKNQLRERVILFYGSLDKTRLGCGSVDQKHLVDWYISIH